MSPRVTAKLFAGLTAVVVAFQLALALGAPWGALAMGGSVPGVYPPVMRIIALLQAAILASLALVVLCRAGVVLRSWRAASRWLAWGVVALLAGASILNLITPSAAERAIWAPVAVALFIASLRVALSR
ncbi:hypothetical protein [Phenylobacterium soli]|uniref:Uncharacterized protein n=1 Tax=Phenylobacterium soli TaxID=2170551 RepID=A0A328AMK6_9CAUL|nr:hypothetical protein [Phenylobacterium soli]RAK55575.1 hypothetical protein DJ017_14185 [Phenylobacterium soli]